MYASNFTNLENQQIQPYMSGLSQDIVNVAGVKCEFKTTFVHVTIVF